MTREPAAPQTNGDIWEMSRRLTRLLDSEPTEAIRQARQIDLASSDRLNAMSVRAAILVDGGAATRQQDAIEEGLKLFREVYAAVPDTSVAYNLANALVSVVGTPPHGPDWLDHQERTREQRSEARQTVLACRSRRDGHPCAPDSSLDERCQPVLAQLSARRSSRRATCRARHRSLKRGGRGLCRS